ncbi:hypothetical protein, partial [Klebsiella pneumoniae]|uniref:hypothetical protein n=1 Tax=Klebsiella pneumoniae TaxID=573 RepID=UPI001C6F7F02
AEQEGQQTETEATGAPQKHHYTLNQQVGSITMKCYYIVIEYLPGYSFDQMFLKCAETLPDAHSMNIQIQETIRNCS